MLQRETRQLMHTSHTRFDSNTTRFRQPKMRGTILRDIQFSSRTRTEDACGYGTCMMTVQNLVRSDSDREAQGAYRRGIGWRDRLVGGDLSLFWQSIAKTKAPAHSSVLLRHSQYALLEGHTALSDVSKIPESWSEGSCMLYFLDLWDGYLGFIFVRIGRLLSDYFIYRRFIFSSP